MSFGEKVLKKYGWAKGKGLGKEEDGVSKPIKVGLKFDKGGIGYNEKKSKDDNDQWWVRVFNEAAATNSTKIMDSNETPINKHSFDCLTDEELFRACGGRTAHKGARHGIKQMGKLNRIENQEISESNIRVNTNDASSAGEGDTRVKLKRKKKSKNVTSTIDPIMDVEEINNCHVKKSKKKKRKMSNNI